MTLPDFYLYQWIDIMDAKTGIWMEAQIINLDDDQIRVRYLDSTKNKDCVWTQTHGRTEDLKSNSSRICPYLMKSKHMIDRKKRPFLTNPITLGSSVDCLDTLGKWYAATIIGENPDHQLWQVHFHGCSEKWDEWLNASSYRLANANTYVDNRECEFAIYQLQNPERSKGDTLEKSISLLKNLVVEEANINAALALSEYSLGRDDLYAIKILLPFLSCKSSTSFIRTNILHCTTASGVILLSKLATKLFDLETQNEDLQKLLSTDMTKCIQYCISTFL